MDTEITRPVPCPQAFMEEGEASVYSRAAFLLALGILLRPDHDGQLQELYEEPPFELPRMEPIGEIESWILDRFGIADRGKDIPSGRLEELGYAEVCRIYDGENQEQLTEHAIRLLSLYSSHINELLKTAALVSLADLFAQHPYPHSNLRKLARFSKTELVRSIAGSALARHEDDSKIWQLYDRVFDVLFLHGSAADIPARKTDAVIIHGTVFRRVGGKMKPWWRPGSGDFHTYLRKGPRPGVYSKDDYYRWGGGWSDFARFKGAWEFRAWCNQKNLTGFDLFTHSHGGNVAMTASNWVKFENLVLMSCPVHENHYQLNFNNVHRVISIRVKWDLVILADRGGQHFRDKRIHEEILPYWFDHSKSRRSKTWINHNLDALL